MRKISAYFLKFRDSHEAEILWLSAFIFLVLLLPFLSLFRLTAFSLYGNFVPTLTSHYQWKELIHAFWMGFRFDSVIIFYIMAPLTLLLTPIYLFFQNQIPAIMAKIIKRFMQVYLAVFVFLVLIILAIDVKYFSYFQDHINILIFGFLDDDTRALIKTFWKNYPVLIYFSVFGVGFVILWKLIVFVFNRTQHLCRQNTAAVSARPLKMKLLIVPLVWIFTFIGGRGSFGLFPLGPADTVISKDSFVNYLTTNGVHALYRAIKLRRTQSLAWNSNLKYFNYASPEEAFADYFQIPKDQLPQDLMSLFMHKTKKNPWAEKERPHVIVLVMESFGTFWLRYHSADFNLLGEFENQLSHGVFLKNFMPASGSTTGSLSSLMVSSPHRPIGNFLTESEYLQVPFRSSPARIFKSKGYRTRFIYGGNPGWRDMNKFAKFQGFDSIEGDVDIEQKLGPVKEKHDWGIYDEDLFRYIEVTLKEAQEPQMLLVMTTTNHPPYQVPSSFQFPELKIPAELSARLVGDSKELVGPRMKVYHYSNDQLGQFLKRIREGDPAKMRTPSIVAVTGDHSFNLINFADSETFYKWSVPLFLQVPPGLKLEISRDHFGSHMDIFPTLYNLALSETEYLSLGKDLNDPTSESFAVHSSGVIANKESVVLHFSGQKFSSQKWINSEFLSASDFSTANIESTETTAGSENLARQFRGLMGLMDYYFFSEKKLHMNK